jgi:hypothetical protein
MIYLTFEARTPPVSQLGSGDRQRGQSSIPHGAKAPPPGRIRPHGAMLGLPFLPYLTQEG